MCRSDTKCKYMLMFYLKNLARKDEFRADMLYCTASMADSVKYQSLTIWDYICPISTTAAYTTDRFQNDTIISRPIAMLRDFNTFRDAFYLVLNGGHRVWCHFPWVSQAQLQAYWQPLIWKCNINMVYIDYVSAQAYVNTYRFFILTILYITTFSNLFWFITTLKRY